LTCLAQPDRDSAAPEDNASPAYERLERWVRDHVFKSVHGSQLIYNTCWEDPRLDRQALQVGPRDVIVTITSAGCNALDYALQGPAHVHAVDVNPRQNALLELKIAGIRALDFETFFTIFGAGRHPNFARIYESQLRPLLSPRAGQYWDRRRHFFTGEGHRPTFYFHGTTGIFAWLLNLYVNRVISARRHVDAMLDADSLDAQRDIYHRQLRPRMWRPSLRWLLRRDTVMSMLGVPRPQRDQIDQQFPGGLSTFIENCVNTVFGEMSLRDNYFWRVYLTGRYTRDCCPDYLKPAPFHRLKNGLVDRVSVHTMSIAQFLESSSFAGGPGAPTRFVLLDHMDWLAAHHAPALRREWQAIVDRAAPSARLLWRSAGTHTDFVNDVPIRVAGRTRRVGDLLRYNRPLAARLHQLDRVHTYGSFHVADLCC
jgi:S-adenosylmethionine-diacylglycerol 3-amino-3-carboxypropyl transferase